MKYKPYTHKTELTIVDGFLLVSAMFAVLTALALALPKLI